MVDRLLAGKVQTVLGLVDPADLGVTLAHEHLFVDGPAWYQEASDAQERELACQPVTLETLGWIRYHPSSNLDNIRLADADEAIEEAGAYQRLGGRSMVDVTSIGIGRNAEGLARIARATGLNIVMGCGYYVQASHPPDLATMSEDEVAQQIINDITVGVGDSAVRAGIIGEIGCSWPLADDEKKVLRASARAQQATGAPLSIHPGRHEKAAVEIVEVLAGAGACLERTVIGHMDRNVFDHELRLGVAAECASAGCMIAYDQFGCEGYYPLGISVQPRFDIINDRQRIDDIWRLIDRGHLDRILVGHDIDVKVRRRRYGGHGLGHILENVLPRMRDHGITDDTIRTILVDNPARLLTFAEH
jgi:phosphotriesterase-related protein